VRAVTIALLLLAGCGGGAKEGAPASASAASAPTGPVPSGWTQIDEPTFNARIPAGFETRNQIGGRVFTVTRDDIAYTVAHRTIEPELEGQVEKVFDLATEAFFRQCRGARVRTVRADTLEHKTATVDGTCGRDKPAMGQVHVRGRDLFELYVVVSGERMNEDDLRGFFRAFRVKASAGAAGDKSS
jgi:hypothetical protein